MILKNRKGTGVTITGVVAHCRHVSGRVHEIGVLLHKEIRVEAFIAVPGDASGDSPGRDANDIYSRIEAMAVELQSLASERTALDPILKLIGKLALLASPSPSPSPPPPHARQS